MSLKFKVAEEENVLEIYVNGKQRTIKNEVRGAYAYLLKFGGREELVSGTIEGGTGVKATMVGIIHALNKVTDKSVEVKLYTDNDFIVNSVNKTWYKGWRFKGWKKKDGGELANKDEWRELTCVYEMFDNISFNIVDDTKSHDNMLIVDNAISGLLDDNYKPFDKKVIAVDFDGTITLGDNYPDLGIVNKKAIDVINKIKKRGHEIIIWTCRDSWIIEETLNEHGIMYDAINENTEYLKEKWGNNPRKVGADILIDDKSLFYVNDWSKIEDELIKIGVL